MAHDYMLKVGSVVRLNSQVTGIYKCDTWKTGLYKVVYIRAGFGTPRSQVEDVRYQHYGFRKIRKDGTEYKTFRNGYSVLAFEAMIREGKVTVL